MLASEPAIAVCIGCFNQGHYLEGAIQSALGQTYGNIEIWVSDDCSTDNTWATILTLQAKYPLIKFFRQEVNRGVAGNNSWLLAQPQTELIVRLDSDDRLAPDYVRIMSQLLLKYPRAGFAHCHSNQIDQHGNTTRVLRIRPRPEYVDGDWALRDTAGGMRVAANNLIYRASAVREAGYFQLGMRFSEDWDLLVKMADLGWGNAYLPHVLASYRVWSDPAGFRISRKLAEVTTTIEVYENRLEPAYRRRGWDLRPLQRARKRKAVRFTDALDSSSLTPQEQRTYQNSLIRLGDSAGLRWRFLLWRMGALPALRAQRLIVRRLKDYVKSLVDARRESASPPTAGHMLS